jgi:hypothetical protein
VLGLPNQRKQLNEIDASYVLSHLPSVRKVIEYTTRTIFFSIF